MRITAFLLLLGTLHLSATGLSQTVTLTVKERPLFEVLQSIRQQTGYVAFSNETLFEKARPVTLRVQGASLEETLALLFRDQPLTYELANKTIVIKEAPRAVTGSDAMHRVSENGSLLILALPTVSGKIVDSLGNPLSGASIRALNAEGKRTTLQTLTDSHGEFTLRNVPDDASLEISYIGYVSRTVRAAANVGNVVLKAVPSELAEVAVQGYTGYQVIDKNHPGSFDVVGSELFNRRVSSDILSRIENLTPGVLFDKTASAADGLLIRGRNSIFSNVAPLIVIDNFPYDGNLDNINPNDVASVTILKDAAAAAQWGARAGNGVIVITTKRGLTTTPSVSINTNLTHQAKPDLWSLPIISSADAIELEKWLFGNGYYNAAINNQFTKPHITPVQEILVKQRNGILSESQANDLIEQLKEKDVRDDLSRYFYQNTLAQQHALNVSGNTPSITYYLSAGWDKRPSNLVGNGGNNRISLRTQNTFKVTSAFSINAGLNYTQYNNTSGNNPGISINTGSKGLYPYADLVDKDGNALVLERDFRNTYTDTAGVGKILDWKYRPYAELDATESRASRRDLIMNTGLTYQLGDLNIEGLYQFHNTLGVSGNLQKVENYSTRNLINRFYQPNAANQFPVPIGGIYDYGTSEIISHQGRLQLSYKKDWANVHKLTAFAGWEIKDLTTKGNTNRLYGYDRKGSVVNGNMDYVTQFSLYPRLYTTSRVFERIPNGGPRIYEQLDRFWSYYGNASYQFKNKYSASGSVRYDAANLFGVKTNQQGVPLWSIGLGWTVNNEEFYNLSWLPQLKIRSSYGYNGNFSRLTTAFTTANYFTNHLGLKQGEILNPPNENLRWEQVRMANFGLDFGFKNDRVTGSLEFYYKSIKDLMGQGPIDPTTGLSDGGQPAFYYGNLAHMDGRGVDLIVNTLNIRGAFNWRTNFLFSYAQTHVVKYLMPRPTSASTYANGGSFPLEGKPLNTIHSYRWGGLDPETGDPQGYLNGVLSKDYNSIQNQTSFEELIYHGPMAPPYFGSLRNTLQWRDVSLSFLLSYKSGYYFRRRSLSYSNLFATWTGHEEYARRWQNPGDELATDVPSLVYINHPDFSARQAFYTTSSSANVERGDHIRLEDINLSYSINKRQWKSLPFEALSIYSYLSNLQLLLWQAGKVDPNLNGNLRLSKSLSFGASVTF